MQGGGEECWMRGKGLEEGSTDMQTRMQAEVLVLLCALLCAALRPSPLSGSCARSPSDGIAQDEDVLAGVLPLGGQHTEVAEGLDGHQAADVPEGEERRGGGQGSGVP